MKIIMSPAKKMKDDFILDYRNMPYYLDKAEFLISYLKSLGFNELKELYQASDKIVALNMENLKNMNLKGSLTPAIYAYSGIAFQYLSPDSLSNDMLDYLESHLCILSALYGVLKPMDGVTSYRLEMQARAKINEKESLYEYWGKDIYDGVMDKDNTIINLASEEYSRCITEYKKETDKIIDVIFVEEYKGHLVTKGVYAKMARGRMVRYMAENHIEDSSLLKNFNELGYTFRSDISTDIKYVFERNTNEI